MADPPPPCPARRWPLSRSRTLAAALVVLVLFLIQAGVSGAAAVRVWNGWGPQPEEAVPATMALFARVDLAPGLEQRVLGGRVLGKLTPGGAGGVKEWLAGPLGTDPAGFAAHVRPWLGERIGVGYWTDTRHAYGVVVLAVDGDESRARDLLGRMPTIAGITRAFEVADGWALVLSGTSEVDLAFRALLAQRATGRLADSAAYRRGLAALPARQTALAWADLAQRAALTQASIVGSVETATPSMLPFLLSFVAPAIDRGTVVAGARATTSGVEVRLRGSGLGWATSGDADVLARLGALPAGSTLAAVGRPPATGAMPMLTSLMASLFPAVAPENPPTFDEFEDFADLESDPIWKALTQRGETLALAVAFLSIATAELSMTDTTTDPPALRVTGAATPGSSIEGSSPEQVAAALAALGGPATTTWDGTRIEVRTPGYDAAGGRLADDPRYRQAMAGMPRDETLAGYLRARDGTLPGIGPTAIVAIGFALGVEDGEPAGLLRVLVS